MVIDINDTLLESIKKELLATLKEAESRVTDMFEFGETHGSDATLGLLSLVKNTLLMIGEPSAASLCKAIYATIEKSLGEDNIDEDSGVANSFLTLSQYVERLSVGGSPDSDLEAKLLATAQKRLLGDLESQTPQTFKLTSKQKEVLTHELKVMGGLKMSEDKSFWQAVYKSASVTKKQVNTQESHEFIWLVEQVAILNVKGQNFIGGASQKLIFSVYGNYLKSLVKNGETLSGYQQSSMTQGLDALKKITSKAEVVRSDYRPPAYRLKAIEFDEDDLSISVVFPVSAETIEAIAFLVKRELAQTKDIFEKALRASCLSSKETVEKLSVSLKLSKAAFRLLTFSTGLSLLEEAEDLSSSSDSNTWKDKFAENIILVEDALWQLNYLEKTGVVNPFDAARLQKKHTKEMATNAAEVILAQSAFEHSPFALD